MECSCNELFSGRCLASRGECFFVDVVWVLGIINSPPTKVWVVWSNKACFCDVPMLVV